MDGFIFFRSFWEAAQEMPDIRSRDEFYNALFAYAFDGVEPQIQMPFARVAFKAVLPVIEKSRKRSAAGKSKSKSEKIKNDFDSSEKKSKSESEEIKTDFDLKRIKDKEQGIEDKGQDKKSTTRKRFVPPTREEVQAYCAERGNNVNADKFVDYYTSKGWVVGKVPMKDWKAAVRGWEQRDKERRTAAVDNNKFNQGVQSHDYDWDKLERDLLGY